MIDITDVQKVLNDEPNENTICYEYELRPTIIVSDIKNWQIYPMTTATFSTVS